MSKFVAYYRVSTERQGQSGLGLEAQKTTVERHIAGVGGEIIGEYTEVESGKRVTRPHLVAAIKAAREAGAALVVAKLDRLARNARYLLAIRDSGIGLVFCDIPCVPDGATGKLIVGQMALVAEFERDRISERTKAALAVLRGRGKKLGTHGKVLAKRRRQEASAYARGVHQTVQLGYGHDLRGMTIREAREFLNSREIYTRTGKPWGMTTTQRLVDRIKHLESAGLEQQ